MVDISEGYCKKPPQHLNQRCSDFCPCGETMECKIKEFRNSKGNSSYIKQCLKMTDPESVNIYLLNRLGFAKRSGYNARIPRDSTARRGNGQSTL